MAGEKKAFPKILRGKEVVTCLIHQIRWLKFLEHQSIVRNFLKKIALLLKTKQMETIVKPSTTIKVTTLIKETIFVLKTVEFSIYWKGFWQETDPMVDAQDQLADESSVNGTVNKLFWGGFHEDVCNDTCMFSQVQHFSDDPALGASQITEDLDENSDSVDSFVKITELSSSNDSPLYAGSPITVHFLLAYC